MVRIVVSFSGGKDSQAVLIYAAKKYGNERVEAVFCDTGWEHPLTVNFVKQTCKELGVKLTILQNKRNGEPLTFEGLCTGMELFPVPKRRVCTLVLKVEPMIEWILEQDDDLIIMQGIRAKESQSRSEMATECMYFAEYFDELKSSRLYKKTAVKKWCQRHDASLVRPIFNWTAQEVIDYILDAGMKPNPLYKRGASRVGCFPCIMSRQAEIKLVARDEEMRNRLIDLETKVNKLKSDKGYGFSGFFTKGIIPERFCKTHGNGTPTAQEVFDNVTRDDIQLDLFEPEEGYSCMSLYHGLCE